MSHQADDAVTIARTKLEGDSARSVSFVLRVVEGPDKGASLTIDASSPSRVLIGQSPACALHLTDRSVSRRHLAADVRGARLRLTDLESTNGTAINSVSVVDAWCSGGELVRIGDTTLRIELSSPEHELPLSRDLRFGRVVGGSAEMRRLYPLCTRLANAEVPVVIEGETGTGKELLAESLHEAGPRANGPFVVFDCTAVPANLMESSLFGHERGSFTGAVSQRKGVFEQAHGGTLFIDEIGDLDLTLQPKLLRAIQRSEVQRVGGDKWLKVDVRVVSATRRDLDREVAEGRFRDDLFFRLAVARIELPPLRRRRGDVALLTRHFFRLLKAGEAPPELIAKLETRDWPGNVRELFNAVSRFVALGELAAPRAEPLDDPEAAPAASSAFEDILALDLPLSRAREKLVESFERAYVDRVLERHGGNVRRAAEASGIARRYFQILRARQGK